MSISSALTKVPSLSSFSPFAGGVGEGGGGIVVGGGLILWTPWQDRHLMGKSFHFPLIKIKNNVKECCLGCIGTDERRFFQRTVCNMVAHRKCKYDLSFQEGYFILTQSNRALRQPSAFRTSFLDAARLTKEVRFDLTSTGDVCWKTTSEWEEFILQAEIAWHAQLVEEQWGL
jgi:hypothetical protein